MYSPRLILAATDFSDFSGKGVSLAAEIAERTKAQIHLIHVVDTLQQCVMDYCFPADEIQQIEIGSLKEAAKKLQAEANRIKAAKRIDVTFNVKAGVAYKEILTEQRDRKADLIVIASHGRTGFVKTLLGSVAERVIRGADCPVLVAR